MRNLSFGVRAGCVLAAGLAASMGPAQTTAPPAAKAASINDRINGDITPVHDPAIIKQGDTYYLFSTSQEADKKGLLHVRSSRDLVTWKREPPAFAVMPAWAKKAIPGTVGLWAPDVVFSNGRYRVYYSVSTFRSNRKIMLSVDEWNVWYKAHTPLDLKKPGWPEAPPLLEEIYNFEDALVVGGALITLINNSDRVKSACLAQLVNVLGPIFTETGGPAWRQTIFHPFAHATRYARGTVLRSRVTTDTFDTPKLKNLPLTVSSVVHDEDSGQTTILVLNRSKDEPCELTVELRGMTGQRIATALELHHDDLKAINSKDSPDEVSPRDNPNANLDGTTLTATLKPLSWNVFVVEPSA